MTFLLQYFLNHQCIDRSQILEWYNADDGRDYRGFTAAKQFATSFINSLSTSEPGNDDIDEKLLRKHFFLVNNKQQTVSLDRRTDQQDCGIEIKLESIAWT